MHRVPYWKFALIYGAIVFSLLMLYPSYKWLSLTAQQKAALQTDEMKGIQSEIDLKKEEKKKLTADTTAAEANKEQIDTITADIAKLEAEYKKAHDWLVWHRGKSIHLGLDLQGGLRAVIQVIFTADTGSEDEVTHNRKQTMDGVLKVINERINKLGLAETVAQIQGDDRILVQVPGVADEDMITKIIGTTAKLEFKLIQEDSSVVMATLSRIDKELGENLVSRIKPGGEILVSSDDYDHFQDVLENNPVARLQVDSNYKFAFGEETGTEAEGKFRSLWLVQERTEMDGSDIKDAFPTPDLSGGGGIMVILNFGHEGAARFAFVTKNNVGNRLAVVLDGVVYSAPTIQQEIPNGSAQITGNFTPEEGNNLSVVLRAGNLPAEIEIIETNIVGPVLGRDSIRQSVYAGTIGALAVLLLIAVYYSLFGVVTDFALLLNVFFTVAGLAAFQATFTLPGIAGLFLIIGMAVDANVLVFERMREEKDSGHERTLGGLLNRGYSRAFNAILDGHVTTIITGIILFQFGTGPIKGFAVTLVMGLIISLFTSLFVTRTAYDWLGYRGIFKDAYLGKMRFFHNTHYNFMGMGFKPVILSAAVIVVGLFFIAKNGGLNLGVEFTGGTEIVATFDKALEVKDVKKAMPEALHDYPVQRDANNPQTFFIKVKALTDEQIEPLRRDYAAQLTAGATESQTIANARTSEIVKAAFAKNEAALGAKIVEGGWSSRDVQEEVGNEITEQSWWAVVVSSLLIIGYMSWRFQFKYAIAAVLALVHDVLTTISIFAMLGAEFGLPVVAALLTIVGYSINDTIVVFDRIRENRRKGNTDLGQVVNDSMNQMLSRTIIMSLTVLIVLGGQLAFGGPVTYSFVLTLFIGVITGSYSSIFIANPLLVKWEESTRKKQLATR